MAFKQDEDFLRFITMGAAGTAAVARYLSDEHGHRTVELERYAMANKIWATKIKRLRLADLVCLDCGLRVEARAKSQLAIRMSHSDVAGRAWDGPMRDEDLCAFVLWREDEHSAVGVPACFTVGAMRRAFRFAKLGPRKSASEGAERDLTWPASVPKADGTVEEIDRATGRVTVKATSGRRQSYSIRGDAPTFIYVEPGQKYVGGELFLLGVVEPVGALRCPGRTWDYARDLEADLDIDRYVAVKAAGLFASQQDERALLRLAEDESQDDRIRLEAWASLAHTKPSQYTGRIYERARERTSGDREAMAMGMEAIFILSELATTEAAESLAALASDDELDSEARCAAVWGLGIAGANEPRRVIPYIADDDEEVALHALAGVGRIARSDLPTVVALLSGSDRQAASAAVLLAEQGDDGLTSLLKAARAGSPWAIGELGRLPEATVRRVAGGDLSDDLIRVLRPLWLHATSWLTRQQMATPLQFLQRQTIRHLAPDASNLNLDRSS
jgi:hypothetical protein